MLIIGALFLLAALGALSVSLGLVALPDKAVRERLVGEGNGKTSAEPAGTRI